MKDFAPKRKNLFWKLTLKLFDEFQFYVSTLEN